MTTRSDKTQQNTRPLPTDTQQPGLLWDLHRILRGINISDGTFRAITGRWPAQLTTEELRAWIDWFSAATDAGEPLPAMPIARGNHDMPIEAAPRQAPRGREERWPETPNAPADSRPVPPTARVTPNHYRVAPARPAPPERPAQSRPEPRPESPPARPEAAPQPAADESLDLTPEEVMFIESIRGGAQVREAAQRAGLSVSTLYQRRSRKPAFAHAWQAALAERSGPYDGPEEG